MKSSRPRRMIAGLAIGGTLLGATLAGLASMTEVAFASAPALQNGQSGQSACAGDEICLYRHVQYNTNRSCGQNPAECQVLHVDSTNVGSWISMSLFNWNDEASSGVNNLNKDVSLSKGGSATNWTPRFCFDDDSVIADFTNKTYPTGATLNDSVTGVRVWDWNDNRPACTSS